LGILAVRIGNPQAVMSTGLGHIGNAGGENAFLARELFIDVVGNAVGHEAQIAGGDREALTTQVLALDHIPKAEAHIPAAIGQTRDAAGRQRIGTLLAPQGHIGTEVSSSAMPEASTPRNCPLRSRSAWMMAEIFCGAEPSPLNWAIAIGNCVRPTPVTSTLNWASAGRAGVAANVASMALREARGPAAQVVRDGSRSIVIGSHQNFRNCPVQTQARMLHTLTDS
jgi:hypothetical protein